MEVNPIAPISQVSVKTQPPAPQQAPPPAVVPTPESAPPDDEKKANDARFAALSRKEKQILLKQRELQQREKLMQERLDRYKPYDEFEQLKRSNPIEALKRMGMSYDELTQYQLNNGLTPEQAAALKAEEIVSQKMQEFQKQQQEATHQQQQEQYDKALTQIRTDAEQIASTGGETYALVKELGDYGIVSELIERTYQESGRIMPIEEALKATEAQCLDWVRKVAKLDKVKAELLTLIKEPQDQKPASPTGAIQQPQTLTHKTTSSPTTPKALSTAEKRAKAIAMIEGRSWP